MQQQPDHAWFVEKAREVLRAAHHKALAEFPDFPDKQALPEEPTPESVDQLVDFLKAQFQLSLSKPKEMRDSGVIRKLIDKPMPPPDVFSEVSAYLLAWQEAVERGHKALFQYLSRTGRRVLRRWVDGPEYRITTMPELVAGHRIEKDILYVSRRVVRYAEMHVLSVPEIRKWAPEHLGIAMHIPQEVWVAFLNTIWVSPSTHLDWSQVPEIEIELLMG